MFLWPNLVTVYIISSSQNLCILPFIVSGKDSILTNSLTLNSHSTKTVLSIDVCLDSNDWLVFISSLFFVSPCVITVVCYVFNVFFFNFLRSCNSVHMSYCIKRVLDLTWQQCKLSNTHRQCFSDKSNRVAGSSSSQSKIVSRSLPLKQTQISQPISRTHTLTVSSHMSAGSVLCRLHFRYQRNRPCYTLVTYGFDVRILLQLLLL